jgi:hypothetical protein
MQPRVVPWNASAPSSLRHCLSPPADNTRQRSGPCMSPSRAFPVFAFQITRGRRKGGAVRCGSPADTSDSSLLCVVCLAQARPAAVARGGQPPTAQTTRKRKKATPFPLKVSVTRDCIIAGLAWVYFCAPSYGPRPRVGRADCQCCPGLWIDRLGRRAGRAGARGRPGKAVCPSSYQPLW